jgi:hypothetical protein
MWTAWDNHPDEYAAGIADSIDKVWDDVNDLYAAADALEADADKLWTLPIYGGRPVAHSAEADPSNPPLDGVPLDGVGDQLEVAFGVLGSSWVVFSALSPA